MRRSFIVIISLLLFISSQAQEIVQYKYWVGFKDKRDSPYSVDRAKEFLSGRALNRRQRLHIQVDESDLPVLEAYVEKISGMKVEVRNRSRWLNGISVYMADTSVVREIRNMPFVKEVKLIGLEPLRAIFKLGDPLEEKAKEEKKGDSEPFSEQYYGAAYSQIAMCNGQKLHKQGFDGGDVWIATLDAGFRNYEKIKALMKMNKMGLIATHDFVQCNDTVSDDDDHGLNVLSCMAAFHPGNMVGTAPGAKYLLLRTEDADSEYPIEELNWLCAAEFADSAGADIITTSLGYTKFDDKSMGHSRQEMDGKTTMVSMAASMAAAKGMLVCGSSGNEGAVSWKYIGAPADVKNILTIGSVDRNGKHSDFSSIGPTKDGRIKPDIAVLGELTTVVTSAGIYSRASGTSFSTPVFSGMLACLVQANPKRTPEEIMQAVKMSSSQYAFPDQKTGYGIPDMELANKILGGDKEFPLDGDRLLNISVPVNSSYLTVTFHAETSQDLKIEITDIKGKKKFKSSFQIKKGDTKRIFIKAYKKLKPGTYKMVVNYAPASFISEFKK